MNNYMKVIINAIKQWVEVKFDALNDALIHKVDVVDGKGLSTEDFTTEEKNKLGSVEAGAQVNVQADWNQNDDTQSNYVKNRTHWEEGFGATIEWDGSTEGRDSFSDGATMFYKVSDLIPTKAELVGGTMFMLADGVTGLYEEVFTAETIQEGTNCLLAGIILVAYATDMVYDGATLTAPSTGMYAAYSETPIMQLVSLTYGSTIVHQLDEKFIPESIARTADIPEINYPVTSVNGMTGDVVIEAGSGGVSSWNDLEDKPFEMVEVPNVITLDTDSTEEFTESDMTLQKVSNVTPTKEELTGAAITVLSGGQRFYQTISEADIIEATNGLIFFEGRYIVFFGGKFEYSTEGGTLVFNPPSPGIYYIAGYNNDRIITIQSGTKFTEKILRDKLYDGGFGWEEYKKIVVEWDGTTDGRVCVDIVGRTFVKVSDILPDMADFYGTVMHLSDGSTLSLNESNMFDDGPMYVALLDLDAMLYGIKETTVHGIEFPGVGLYAPLDTGKSTPHFARIELSTNIIHKLDEKFIPDTIARVEDIPEAPELVNPDWAQNNSTKPDYIQNRTHWMVRNINQLYKFSADVNLESTNSYKCRDVYVYDAKVEAGRSYVVTVDGDEYVLECQECTIVVHTTECANLMLGNIGLFPPRENLPDNRYPDLPFLVQFYYSIDGWERTVWYPNQATLDVEISEDLSVYHPLDEKFIPDTIARKSDATWENLPDKPFGDNQTMIEWDGSTDGRDSVDRGNGTMWYKVSDAMPTMAELNGASVTMTINGQTGINTISETGVMEYDGLLDAYGVGVVVAYNTEITDPESITLPSTGIYFVKSTGEVSVEVHTLTYNSTKTIEEKYLPAAPVTSVNGMTGDIVIDIPSVEGLATETYVNEAISNIPDSLPMPTTATVGQFIMVSAVDENGRVTETKAVDASEVATLLDAEGAEF